MLHLAGCLAYLDSVTETDREPVSEAIYVWGTGRTPYQGVDSSVNCYPHESELAFLPPFGDWKVDFSGGYVEQWIGLCYSAHFVQIWRYSQ